MKIYTRTGDQGETGLVGGRTRKDAIRVEAYGAIDEGNSVIGMAISFLEGEKYQDVIELLTSIQHELFDCGGDLAIVNGAYPFKMNHQYVIELEKKIDFYTAETPPLRRFILPGGSRGAAYLHMSRTIIRRAERRVVTLKNEEEINGHVLTYLNRLSDLLFVLARVINVRASVSDVEYIRGGNVFKTEEKEGE